MTTASRSSALLGALWLFAALAPAQASAQLDRYELGRRLRDFEIAWNLAKPDAAAKKRVLPHLQRAVGAFFTLRASEVSLALTEAKHALRATGSPSSEQLWAASLAVTPGCALLDTATRSLTVSVRNAFVPEGDRPTGLRLVVEVREDGTNDALAFAELVPTELPAKLEVALGKASPREGEHWLDARVFVGDTVLARSSARITFVKDLAARLAALGAGTGTATAPSRVESTDTKTLAMLVRMLGAMAKGKPQETDFAALGLLADAERLARPPADGAPWFGEGLRGDHLVSLHYGGRTVATRVYVPENAKRPAPLVIAFHGAGGSENMFFDAYGAGEIVRRCRELGWVLVTPRGALPDPAAAVETLGAGLQIDRKRVYLVGHSMGAANAAAAAPAIPDLAGVALLGGGGGIRGSWVAIPTFLGAGSADFGRSGVRSTKRALEAQQLPRLLEREYPDVEHLAVVAVALPDVFDFFLSRH